MPPRLGVLLYSGPTLPRTGTRPAFPTPTTQLIKDIHHIDIRFGIHPTPMGMAEFYLILWGWKQHLVLVCSRRSIVFPLVNYLPWRIILYAMCRVEDCPTLVGNRSNCNTLRVVHTVHEHLYLNNFYKHSFSPRGSGRWRYLQRINIYDIQQQQTNEPAQKWMFFNRSHWLRYCMFIVRAIVFSSRVWKRDLFILKPIATLTYGSCFLSISTRLLTITQRP